jgi:hypothetical protein
MKKLILLVVLVRALLLPTHIDAEAAVKLTFGSKFGEDAFEHRYEGGVAAEGRLFVALKKRSVGETSGPWASWIWSIDTTGKLIRTLELREPNQLPAVDGPDVAGMTMLHDGSLACAVITRKGELKIARIADKDVTWSLGDKTIGGDLHISRLFPTSDGNLIIVGQRTGQPLYMKVTPAGLKVWERRPDHEGRGIVLDGVPTSDGGGFIVADYWDGDPFMMGESWIWIAKVDTTGAIVRQKRFRGRRPRMAASDRNSFVLVYDESSSVSQRILLQAFEETLDPAWSTAVVENQRGLGTFKIDRVMQEGFVVTGGDDLKLFVSLFDTAGKDLWSLRDPATQSSDFDVSATKDAFFVVYPVVSTLEVGSHRHLNTKIGVLSFRVEH